MEQLIFVGIILFFSILEAVARKGRQQRQQERTELPEPEDFRPRPAPAPRPRPRPQSGGVPQSYDEDASFDESVTGDERVVRSRRGDQGAARSREGDQAPARTTSEGAATSSEGLIPADIWKEIEALARGGGAPVPRPPMPQAPPAPRRSPQVPRVPRPPSGKKATPRARPSTPTPPVTRRAGPTPVPVPEAPPAEGTPDHPVHLSHAAFGTPLMERTAPPLARAAGRRPAAADSVRALVKGQRSAVRNAVILQEVLGPPVGLRE